MVYVIVDPTDSNRVLHVETKFRSRTAAEVAAGHLIYNWPDSLDEIHIGQTVTIVRDQITAHAKHDTDASELAAKLAQARQNLVEAYLATVRLSVRGGFDDPAGTSNRNAREATENQYKVMLTYAYRECAVGQTDGDDALTAASHFRRFAMPSDISPGGIISYAAALERTASLRRAWAAIHTARNVVQFVSGGTDVVLESGVAANRYGLAGNAYNTARRNMVTGIWSAI